MLKCVGNIWHDHSFIREGKPWSTIYSAPWVNDVIIVF